MSAIVICGPRSYIADDVHTSCTRCAAAIVHRPHIPAGAETICTTCGAAEMDARRRAGHPVQPVITQSTIRDLIAYFGRRGSA